MLMFVFSALAVDETDLSSDLGSLGLEFGVVIRCQHEDIFNVMHRI